jgi:hypothetical protein
VASLPPLRQTHELTRKSAIQLACAELVPKLLPRPGLSCRWSSCQISEALFLARRMVVRRRKKANISCYVRIVDKPSIYATFGKSSGTKHLITTRWNETRRSETLPQYHVEDMNGDTVTAIHIVNATTPLRAAGEATERPVTLRTIGDVWIRVTDEKRGHVFDFSFSL